MTTDPTSIYVERLLADQKRYAAVRVQELRDTLPAADLGSVLDQLTAEAEAAESNLPAETPAQRSTCVHCGLPIFKIGRFSWKHDTTRLIGRVMRCKTANDYERGVYDEKYDGLVATPERDSPPSAPWAR